MGHIVGGLGLTSSGYRIIFLLHITCVIVGFGSTFVYPIMGAQAGKRRGREAQALSETSMLAAKTVTTPFIYAAGFFGLLLVLVSDAWGFDQIWVQASTTVFVAAVLFAGFVHVPNLRRLDELTRELAAMGPPPQGVAPPGPPPQVVEMEQRAKRAPMTGGVLHLALLVLLILMIWKPT